MNFFTKVTIGVGLAIAIASAVILLSRDPEVEKIEEQVRQAVEGAARYEPERAIAMISKDFSVPGDHDSMTNRIRAELRPGRYEELRIKSLETSVQGKAAKVRLLVEFKTAISSMLVGVRYEVDLNFRKEGEEWKVVSYVAEMGRKR